MVLNTTNTTDSHNDRLASEHQDQGQEDVHANAVKNEEACIDLRADCGNSHRRLKDEKLKVAMAGKFTRGRQTL